MGHEETVSLPPDLKARCLDKKDKNNDYGVENCLGCGAGGVVLVGACGPAHSPATNSWSACVLHCMVLALAGLLPTNALWQGLCRPRTATTP